MIVDLRPKVNLMYVYTTYVILTTRALYYANPFHTRGQHFNHKRAICYHTCLLVVNMKVLVISITCKSKLNVITFSVKDATASVVFLLPKQVDNYLVTRALLVTKIGSRLLFIHYHRDNRPGYSYKGWVELLISTI